jgi:hypothetical protein
MNVNYTRRWFGFVEASDGPRRRDRQAVAGRGRMGGPRSMLPQPHHAIDLRLLVVGRSV